MSYVLADERVQVKKKPPFAPLPLFFLTIFFFPLAIPFWVINWGRFGDYRMRVVAAFFGILGVVLLIALSIMTVSQGWKPRDVRFIVQLYDGAYALVMYYPQVTLYRRYRERGGAKAPVWPLLVTVAVGVLFVLVRTWNQLN